MTDAAGIAFLVENGWSEADAAEAVRKYYTMTEEVREYISLEEHLGFLLGAIYKDTYPISGEST